MYKIKKNEDNEETFQNFLGWVIWVSSLISPSRRIKQEDFIFIIQKLKNY